MFEHELHLPKKSLDDSYKLSYVEEIELLDQEPVYRGWDYNDGEMYGSY